MVTIDYTEKEKELLEYMAQGYELYNNIADPDFNRDWRRNEFLKCIQDGIRVDNHFFYLKFGRDLTDKEKEERIQAQIQEEANRNDKECTEPELKRARAWKSGEYDNKRHVFIAEERNKERKTFLKFFFLILTAPAWLPFYIILQVFLITGVMGDGNGGDRWHM